jgi:amidophosphoribosyltransferase
MTRFEHDDLHEECGVFGAFGYPESSKITYLGLYALQHRGQESAGIVTGDFNQHRSHHGMGLVADVFNETILNSLTGPLSIGHVRYSTTGSSHLKNAQPICVACVYGEIALAHNGNLVNSDLIRRELESQGSIFNGTTDTEVIAHLMAKSKKTKLEEIVIDALVQVKGAYSLLILSKDTLIGIRDPLGFRPLCLGQLNGAWLLASESCAFDIINAKYIREVKPGEMIIIDKQNGLRSFQAFPTNENPLRQCIFELIYFSRPDSTVFGENVYSVRKDLGKQLAKEHPVDADVVISIPDSANIHALGYAEQSGIHYDVGLIRNHYVGRTFIEPRQSIRDFGVKIKHNPVRDVLNGKRVIVVEDSIVRGTTSRKIMKMLREGGAKEIHLRVASPPYISPCYYGIDTPNKENLIAANMSIEEIKNYVEVDSLGYLSMEGMLKVMGDHQIHFCRSCFDGKYPVTAQVLPEYEQVVGK